MSKTKETERTIFFCIPGSNKWRNKFRDEILEPFGLLPYCKEIAQVASPIGRDKRSGARNFPEHYPNHAVDSEYLIERFASRTKGTLNRLEPMFGEFSFVMADYEPRTYDEDGNILRRWMVEVTRRGFTMQDLFFLGCMRQGTKDGADGLPYIEYNLPRFPIRPDFDLEQFIAVSTFAHHGWANDAIWHGLYPTGRESLEYSNSQAVVDRVISGRNFLRPLGKRIIAGIHPRFFFQHNAVFHNQIFNGLIQDKAEDVVIWLKLGERNSDGSFNELATQFMYDEYAARFKEIAPTLKLWAGGA